MTGAGSWPGRLVGRFFLPAPPRPSQSGERHASWLELFFDLVFVLALSAVISRLGEESTPRGPEVALTLGLFLLVQWAWIGQVFYDTRYDPDDTPHRLLVLVATAGAGAVALGVTDAPQTTLLPVGYLVVRGVLLLLYLRARTSGGPAREVTTVYLTGFTLGWLIWLGSLALPVQLRPLAWAVALAVELVTPWLGLRWLRHAPVDDSHLPERIGQFTIIVLGSTLADLVDAVPPRPAQTVVAAAAVAFVVPAAIWWSYTTFVATGLARPKLQAGQNYAYLHAPVGAALLLIGWSLGQVVREVDARADKLSGALRLLLAGSIVTWILCGLALHAISVRQVTSRPIVVACLSIGAVSVIAALVSNPAALLLLTSVTVVVYTVEVSRRLTALQAARG